MSQNTLSIGKFSLGMGDRFAQEAEAQLRACILAAERGADVVPVWNKSNREHMIIGSEPPSVSAAAEAAIRKLGWAKEWHIDADHIRLETVDRFMSASDFFTIDVADSIGKAAKPEDVKRFVDKHPELIGSVAIPGVDGGAKTTRADVERVANKFLLRCKRRVQSIATSKKPRAKASSFRRFRWMKPTRRKRRLNC